MPAGIGAGPVPKLGDLCGCDFESAYMQAMFQHHSDIATLSGMAIEQASDRRLRDLAGKIRYEQTKYNQKLALWYPEFTTGCKIDADYVRPQAEFDAIKCLNGCEFDQAFAAALVNHLQQSKEAAELAMVRATHQEIKDQAKLVAHSAGLEINALQRWCSGRPITVAEARYAEQYAVPWWNF